MEQENNDELEFLELEEEQMHKEVEPEVPMLAEKKKGRGLRAYLIFLSVILVAAALFLVYAHSVIKEYDRLHPDTYLAQALESLSANGFSDDELAGLTVGPFDDAAQIYADANAKILGKELTARFKYEDFDTQTLHYNVYADGEKVTEVCMTIVDSFTKLHVFQMSHYDVDAFNPPTEISGTEAIRVTVPEGYSLYLNGLLVPAEYIVEEAPVEALLYCEAYVEELPQLTTYEVQDVYEVKEVRVTDGNGDEKYAFARTAETTVEDDYVVEAVISQEESEAPEDFKNMVYKMVKDYADFFSGDLPGCAESVACIAYMFPADSMYLELAERYRIYEKQNFTSHTDNHYTDEKMDGYIQYRDDLIVCHVTMQKHMNVWGRQVVDPIDTIYYFVKDGDRWVIADMQ